MARINNRIDGGWSTTLTSIMAGRGYALLPAMGHDEWFVVAQELGEVIDTTCVELNPAIRTYLCQPGEVPMHCDHPDADLIAWRCERVDPQDTPQLLCDSLAVVAELDEEAQQALMRTRVLTRHRGGLPASPRPVLREVAGAWRLCFAPWLELESADAAGLAAWRQLEEAVGRVRDSFIRVRLGAGEVLVIDNGRMLHGRPPLIPGSPRRLLRMWLRLRP